MLDVAGTVAFGSRPSPIHGNPRPSVWVADPHDQAHWVEAPTLRELFGGENIVSLGGLAAGPHGYALAGTWINGHNRSVATIWQSPNGSHWLRNDSDPALGGRPGELTSALDVADAPTGLVAVGYALVPTAADPAAEIGAIWSSPDGTRWEREDPSDPTLSGPGQTSVEVVTSGADGWLAAGSRTTAAGPVPTVWSSPDGVNWTADALGPPSGRSLRITGAATSGSWRYVAGVLDHRPVLWASQDDPGRPARWQVVRLPDRQASPGLTGMLVAASGPLLLITFRGSGAGVWWAHLSTALL